MRKILTVIAILILMTGCAEKENENHQPRPVEPFDVFTLECSSVTMYKAHLVGIALYNCKEYNFQIRPQFGFCYSRLPDPDVNDSITGYEVYLEAVSNNIFADSSKVMAMIDRLKPGTTYYYRVFARTNDWIRYGEVKTFTTEANSLKPVVDSVYKIGPDSAWIAWHLLTFENANVDSKGVTVIYISDGCEYHSSKGYLLSDTTTRTLFKDLPPDTECTARAFGQKTGQSEIFGKEVVFRTRPLL